MLRELIQVFAVYFIFNPALSFNLYIHLESGSFWFCLFTFVPNLSPFPTLTVLLFKHFQPFSSSQLLPWLLLQIPWGSLNILLRLCRALSCDDVVHLSLLWFPLFQCSHWQGAFMGCPSSLCHVWLWQFTLALSHITLTPSVSPVSTSSTGILTFYFLPPLLLSVTTYHGHPSLLKTYTYFNGLWEIELPVRKVLWRDLKL